MTCLVYVHLCDRVPFYVGIGLEGRPTSKKSRNPLHLNVWNKSVEEEKFEVQVVYRGTRRECKDLEKSLIREFGKRVDGGLLCNFTDGGDGGNTVTPENRERNSQRKSVSMTERWEDPSHREKVTKSMKSSDKVKRHTSTVITNLSPEKYEKFIEKKKERSKELWNDPTYRENHAESMETARAKMSEGQVERWKDPKQHEQHRVATRKKGRWTDEELKEKYGPKVKGRHWWVNRETNCEVLDLECPGPEWVRGRTPKGG